MTTVAELVVSIRSMQARHTAVHDAQAAELEAALVRALAIPPAPPPQRGVLVPAYFSPGSGAAFWTALIAAAVRVPIVAIANPGNGPSTARDARYTEVIARAVAAGARVIGYVSTDYARRDPRVVLADVALWCTLYPQIGGIFFDEQATDIGHIPLYTGYVNAVRAAVPGAFVVLNAGTTCDPGYLSIAKPDVIVMSERAGNVRALPAWAVASPDTAFAAMVHGVSEQTMATVVAQLQTAGYGWIYVTDDTLANNPWNSLPSYWSAEVAALAALTA